MGGARPIPSQNHRPDQTRMGGPKRRESAGFYPGVFVQCQFAEFCGAGKGGKYGVWGVEEAAERDVKHLTTKPS